MVWIWEGIPGTGLPGRESEDKDERKKWKEMGWTNIGGNTERAIKMEEENC